jgi:hypothetical protein
MKPPTPSEPLTGPRQVTRHVACTTQESVTPAPPCPVVVDQSGPVEALLFDSDVGPCRPTRWPMTRASRMRGSTPAERAAIAAAVTVSGSRLHNPKLSPAVARRSLIRTCRPASARQIAVVRPDTPAPTTRASNSVRLTPFDRSVMPAVGRARSPGREAGQRRSGAASVAATRPPGCRAARCCGERTRSRRGRAIRATAQASSSSPCAVYPRASHVPS